MWSRLYLLIWLAFAQFFVTVFSEVLGAIFLHFLVGIAVLVLAFMNYRSLMTTSAPARVKRISKIIPGMAALEGLLGISLYAFTQGTLHWAINVFHLIVALAIIAQASSTATGYDMWEGKEFS